MQKYLTIKGNGHKSEATKSDRRDISFYWNFKSIPAEKSSRRIAYTAFLYFFANFVSQFSHYFSPLNFLASLNHLCIHLLYHFHSTSFPLKSNSYNALIEQ